MSPASALSSADCTCSRWPARPPFRTSLPHPLACNVRSARVRAHALCRLTRATVLLPRTKQTKPHCRSASHGSTIRYTLFPVAPFPSLTEPSRRPQPRTDPSTTSLPCSTRSSRSRRASQRCTRTTSLRPTSRSPCATRSSPPQISCAAATPTSGRSGAKKSASALHVSAARSACESATRARSGARRASWTSGGRRSMGW